ncbi:MAG: ComF family protein [Desulfobacula sp.]|nr:ComF family protein [Desulfobacula sp.]
MAYSWQIPNIRSTIKLINYFFEQLLFPSKCVKCGVYLPPQIAGEKFLDSFFCDACTGIGISVIDSPYCTICGSTFPNSSDKGHVCETCIRTPLCLGKVRAPVEYKGIIQDAIPLFKYKSKLSLLKTLEPMLFNCFLQHYEYSNIDLILPMPLHRHKLKQRGFNQAYLLVRKFEKMFAKKRGLSPSWHLDLSSLKRIKKTAPQTGFDIKERKKNLKNAFQVVHPKKIKNKYILLVDDVFTTGATCNEAAEELLKNGARQVDALVLART